MLAGQVPVQRLGRAGTVVSNVSVIVPVSLSRRGSAAVMNTL